MPFPVNNAWTACKRKGIALAVLLLIGLFALIPLRAEAASSSTTVYVTPSGSKYHRKDCSYTTTVRAMTISQAEAQGYTPCSRCDPDRKSGSYEAPKESVNTRPRNTSEPAAGSDRPSTTDGVKQTKPGKPWSESAILVIVLLGTGAIFPAQKAIQAARQRRWEQLRRKTAIEEWMQIYDGKSFNSVFHPPSGMSLSDQGTVISPGIDLTVYISKDGLIYHRRSCRYRGSVSGQLWEDKASTSRPCKICCPPSYDFKWYKDYRQTTKLMERYSVQLKMENGIMYVTDLLERK